MATYRQTSRADWCSSGIEGINADSLQRIADATEKMAQSYTELIWERDYLKAQRKRLIDRNDALTRSNAALRGVITKLKKDR